MQAKFYLTKEKQWVPVSSKIQLFPLEIYSLAHAHNKCSKSLSFEMELKCVIFLAAAASRTHVSCESRKQLSLLLNSLGSVHHSLAKIPLGKQLRVKYLNGIVSPLSHIQEKCYTS